MGAGLLRPQFDDLLEVGFGRSEVFPGQVNGASVQEDSPEVGIKFLCFFEIAECIVGLIDVAVRGSARAPTRLPLRVQPA